jgi:hypothetical protein
LTIEAWRVVIHCLSIEENTIIACGVQAFHQRLLFIHLFYQASSSLDNWVPMRVLISSRVVKY